MKIPANIEILIVDEFGNPNPIEGIIFTFKIYESEESYYTSSFFKTDEFGTANISQQNLIESSELKWETNIKNFEPIKIEVFILDPASTIRLKTATKNYVDKRSNERKLESYLIGSGFTESNIENAKQTILKSACEQMKLKELFQNAKNDIVNIVTEKVEDIWKNDVKKTYKFVIKNPNVS